jgi:hypothetical protein
LTDNANCGACNNTCPSYAPCGGGLCLGCGNPLTLVSTTLSDGFGTTVAVNGSIVVVGAPYAAGGGYAVAYNVAPVTSAAADAGFAVATQAALVGESNATDFGTSVAVSGSTAAVSGLLNGAPTVWIFELEGASWIEKTTIGLPLDGGTASTSAPVVALDGNTLGVLGVWASEPAIYTGSGSTWTLTATLQPSDATAQLGSIAISGNNILLGGGVSDSAGNTAHYGYLFTLSGATWTQVAQLAPAALSASNAPHFTATYGIGATSAIMATSLGIFPYALSGGAWTAQPEVAWPSADDTGGSATSLSGSAVALAAPNDVGGQGYVDLFGLTASGWVAGPQLTSGQYGDGFGGSVALNNGTLVVGAPGGGGSPNVVYVYPCAP